MKILVTSTNAKKQALVKQFFPTYEIIGIISQSSHPQPFGYDDETRQSVNCAVERIQNIINLTDFDIEQYVFIMSIENGIIAINDNLFDVSDIAIYDVGEKRYHTTNHLKNNELIKVPIDITYRPALFYIQSFKSGLTPGEWFSKQYGWNHSIWRSDLAVDRMIQMAHSMRHLLQKYRLTTGI